MKVPRYLRGAVGRVLGSKIAAGSQAVQARDVSAIHYAAIRSLSMVSPTSGWALAPTTILRTMNSPSVGWAPEPTTGPETTDDHVWYNVTPHGLDVTPTSMLVALNANTAWVTARRADSEMPVVVHTTDAGHTWRSYPLPLLAGGVAIKRIIFIDQQHGWVLISLGVRDGSEGVEILRTTDGGAHWATVSRTAGADPGPDSLPLHGIKTGISFRDADTGWATTSVAQLSHSSWLHRTHDGGLYRTHDGGHTWQDQKLSYPAPYRQVPKIVHPPKFFTPDEGILPVILNTTTRTSAIHFFVTRNGGKTWSGAAPLPLECTLLPLKNAWVDERDSYFARLARPIDAPIPDKSKRVNPIWDFGDPNHGYVVWEQEVRVTEDGGRHWSAIAPAYSYRPSYYSVEDMTQLHFVNARIGWVFAVTSMDPSLLLETTDGGRSWAHRLACVQDQPGGVVMTTPPGM